jgi:hypothetical protein
MGEVFGGLGIVGVLVFVFLAIIMPISVYAAQKWAYKCFVELQRLNENIERLVKTKS